MIQVIVVVMLGAWIGQLLRICNIRKKIIETQDKLIKNQKEMLGIWEKNNEKIGNYINPKSYSQKSPE